MTLEVPGYRLRGRVAEHPAGGVYRAEAIGSPGRLLTIEHLVAAGPVLTEVARAVERRRGCRHPHLLPVLDIVPTRSGLAVVCPATPGGSLADALARSAGGLPATTVATTGARLASALQALHDQGSLQGAIALEDVRFDAEGRPLLAGAVTPSNHAQPERSESPPAASAACIPPRGATTPSDDLVALGVVLSAALLGSPAATATGPARPPVERPWDGTVPLARPMDAPRSLVEAIEQATATDPDDRPSSAEQLARLLDRAARDAAAASPSPGPATVGEVEPTPGAEPTGPRPPRTVRRSLVLVGLLVAAGAVLPAALLGDNGSRPAPARMSVPLLPHPPDPICEDLVPPAGDGALLLVSLDDRGCTTPVRWDGRELSVAAVGGPPRRLLLDAGPQDQLLAADLDCRGHDALVLYRPTSGEVFVLDRLAAPGEEIEVTGQPSGAVGGRATVHPGVDGCDRLVVVDP